MKHLVLSIGLSFCSLIAWAQQKPTIKGGLQNFAQEKLIYPLFAKENCIQGTVEIAFKLNKNAQITYATITKSVGADLDNEALRIVQLSSGKWQIPNDYDTTMLVHSPIKFSLKDFGCEEQNPASQGLAIRRYHEHKKNLDRIINYYKNIDLGRKVSDNERAIDNLKEQIGIDKYYINSLIAIAEKKLKQGDKKGACDDFMQIKYLGSPMGDKLLAKYCK